MWGLAAIVVLSTFGQARAQADILSRDTITGVLDLRLVAADGEQSWVDGGFGKARFGKGDSGLKLGEAAIAWRPQFNENFGAVITAESQQGLHLSADVGEAYLTWRTSPQSPVQLSARAGLLYPPVSLEHDGVLWTVPDTITPSAINSWIGEEGKVAGVEATWRTGVRGQALSLTGGLFGYGDTAGTLLSFRGWAMHDLKSAASSVMPLPPLSRYMGFRQAPHTTSLLEIDGRVGGYGRVEWRPSPRLAFDLFGYDNRGDLIDVTHLEWAWDTRFIDAGARLELDPRTRLKAQVLSGATSMGFPDKGRLWIDLGYSSAYLSATRDIGPGALTGRADYFTVDDRTLKDVDNNAEAGWALTAAYRWDVARRANVVFEVLHIESDRPARALIGEDRRQDQTVFQSALRLDF